MSSQESVAPTMQGVSTKSTPQPQLERISSIKCICCYDKICGDKDKGGFILSHDVKGFTHDWMLPSTASGPRTSQWVQVAHLVVPGEQEESQNWSGARYLSKAYPSSLFPSVQLHLHHLYNAIKFCIHQQINTLND